MFVCLEGVDGVGKSTIAANVRKAFTLNNVILCSDPCKEHPATLALRQFLLARGNSLPVATQIKPRPRPRPRHKPRPRPRPRPRPIQNLFHIQHWD